MPQLTGIQLLEELKNDIFRPLFVIVSAYNDYREVCRLFLSYGFDYLVKPIADCDLVDLLNRLASKIDYVQPKIERYTSSQKLNEILHYIREYSSMNLTLDSISERFGITSGSICNLFAKHLESTFSVYLNATRMEHAKELLLTTNKPIKEIAINCGFSDPLYFTRVFHKNHGMSPTRFREQKL